jgi:hypothetical protein
MSVINVVTSIGTDILSTFLHTTPRFGIQVALHLSQHRDTTKHTPQTQHSETTQWSTSSTNSPGFIVSTELILVVTIAVLALIVGLSEVAMAVNQELEDVASAVGSSNQSYYTYGYRGHGGASAGSRFHDKADFCDSEHDIIGVHPGRGEKGSHGHRNRY